MKNYLFNRYLELRYKKIIRDQKNPEVAQQKAFRRLQKTLKGTKVDEQHFIHEFKTYKEFLKNTLPQTYDHLKDDVETQINCPSKKTLSNEKVQFIGLSSGTTAEKKQIP